MRVRYAEFLRDHARVGWAFPILLVTAWLVGCMCGAVLFGITFLQPFWIVQSGWGRAIMVLWAIYLWFIHAESKGHD